MSDPAFSHDQAADLWRWRQDGGYLRVCGDASRMAKDLDRAVWAIATGQGRPDGDENEELDCFIGTARTVST